MKVKKPISGQLNSVLKHTQLNSDSFYTYLHINIYLYIQYALDKTWKQQHNK